MKKQPQSRKPPKAKTRKHTKKSAGHNTPPRPTGRPSLYSDGLAGRICDLLVEGKSLREIGAMGDMPDKATIIRWLAAHETFRDRYARAREVRAYINEDELLEIADDGRNDYVEVTDEKGRTRVVFNAENVRRSELRVQTRKWIMSKLLPRRYGEKVELSADPERPVTINLNLAGKTQSPH